MDWARIERTLDHLSPTPLATAMLTLLVAAAPLNALRWRLILGADAPNTGSLMKLLLVGLFFNQILPTGVGGDAVRAWRCRNLGVGLGRAIRSVLLDRAGGYVVMAAIYAVSLPLLLSRFSDIRVRAGLVTTLGAALCGLLAIVAIDRLPARLLRRPIFASLAELSPELRLLIADPGRCSAVLGLSGATIVCTAVAWMLIGESIGVAVSFGGWLLVLPPIAFIQLFPVSLAGWGVREAGLVVILAGFGVPAEAALATSLLIGIEMIVLSLPGGLIWLFGWDIPRSVSPSPSSAGVATNPGFDPRSSSAN
jgi:glycosyltransferase 2 family protein